MSRSQTGPPSPSDRSVVLTSHECVDGRLGWSRHRPEAVLLHGGTVEAAAARREQRLHVALEVDQRAGALREGGGTDQRKAHDEGEGGGSDRHV